ncbi:uncharacterized protein LOC117930485 [Vitis riparia]|uniref:uncharacterized protein LOC117930485 n=1 Tax=Vitis riparia TaxID=96939 RepID=UPI00155AE001|nr:uncharacterized protein LOC117930485 [Vitis riparia]
MGTNKERIEQLEDGLHRMELGMADRLRQVEENLNRLSDVLLANPKNPILGSITNREGNGGGRLVVSSKTAKLEFPRFSGDDPTEWFNRVNQFFEFQNTPEAQKVSLASYHLEGEANQWWQWIHRTFQEEGRVLSWMNFEDELWAHFGPSECEDFDEALSRIRQVGSLRDYQREFERLGNQVQGWTQRALVGTFMGGLRPDISDGIQMFKPQTLKEAISLARMKDDQLARQRRFGRLAPPTRAPLTLPPTQLATPPAPAASVRRLSWEKMQRRRAQNLCFNCNDRFTTGHKCLGPRILLLEGYEDNDDLLCDEVTEEQPAGQNHEGSPGPEITLHALMGWTVPKTMRIATRIGAHDVVVLIDSGSTHNFISECMANLLRLPVVLTKSFKVRVANGENLRCQGRFEEVQINLQGTIFSLTLYSLPLTGLDIVLGIQWLELLGSVVCDWRELTMEFMWENQTKKLVGIDGQHIQAASIEELTKEIRPSHAQFALCLQVAHTEPQQNIHSSMREILQEFSDLFIEPSSLPLTREVDHSIALKEGTEPINVWPYRYAHYQKNKIEKQIITHSTPQPLKIFPIPTVDDMLDELYGASYFTKLDLRAGYHQTFEILRQHRFFVKASKCAFGQQELEYLGHIITRKGVKVDENKIAAMVAWPRPTNISELRGFLGLIGYYQKFVKDYGIIARPLTNLLKKGQFGWHGEAETAFLALK